MSIIKSNQYWINRDRIRDVEAFKDRFTFRSKYKEKESVPTYTVSYSEGTTYYGFPRHTQLEASDVVEDRTTQGSIIEVPFLGEMWEYQEPVILDFVDKIKSGHTDMILSAETGSGKTVMLLKMWSLLGVTALVIVPKSDLIDQWRQRIKQFTGIEDEDIGVARQNVCQWHDKKITIGMIHSICKDKYPMAFKNWPGLVIFDELHRLGAYTFSQAGVLFPARYRLGATATLRRADGLASVFYAHLGKEVIRPLKGVQPKPKIVIIKYSKSSGRIPYWANSKIKRRGVLFSLLSENTDRTNWIADLTNQVYTTGRQTLVIGERIQQLLNIKDALMNIYRVPVNDMGVYIGRTPQRERDWIAKNAKIILATTSMLSEGTDIPTLRGLIFATPLADVEQAVGRICRVRAGTSYPVVIDIVDSFYTDANNWLRGRLKLYKGKEWETVWSTGARNGE